MQEYSTTFVGESRHQISRNGIFNTKRVSKRAMLRTRQVAEIKLTCEAVAQVFNIPSSALISPTRGEAHVAQARQLAMYLANVTFGVSLGSVGRHFGRDRTTAAYACRRIEDRRDNQRFDLMVDHLEQALVSLAGARLKL